VSESKKFRILERSLGGRFRRAGVLRYIPDVMFYRPRYLFGGNLAPGGYHYRVLLAVPVVAAAEIVAFFLENKLPTQNSEDP
jgi:hypothetical protein